MRKRSIGLLLICVLPAGLHAQCTKSNLNPGNTGATSCVCPPGGGVDCDLLPDITIAKFPLNQPSNYTEYPQVCNPPCSGNDGRLRIGVSTPIIGYGPLESRGTSWYVCGTDTLNAGSVANIPSSCPGTGQPPKQLINQRIFHKSTNEMTYWDRPAGSMTFHPSHGHQHVDDWGVYSLRINDGNPDPLAWPVVGVGSKLGYCLLDLGNCTASNGYCVDSMGTILNNTNIPNYGLGGGTYGCSNTMQGISNGYIDTYSQNLDGMWINIPPGTCNGTYWVVAQVDPYDYFLETNENNNVVAVPITLTQQSAAAVVNITANTAMPVCESDTVTLTSSPGDTYQWSNGASTQQISVTGASTYTVTITNSCGTTSSTPFVITTTAATPPAATGDSVCGSGAMTLTASGGGTLQWFNSPAGGTVLDTGTTFVTPVLTATQIFHVWSMVTTGGQSLFCPPADNNFGSGSNFTGSQYLQFDVHNPCTLASVKVYASTAGSFDVQLLDDGGSQLLSANVSVPSGESRITLNFPLSPGTAYRLTRAGNFSLFRNSTGVAYPYMVNDYVTITNSSAGSAFYYFFYDWEVVNPVKVCYTGRTPVMARVFDNPLVAMSGLNTTYHLTDPPVALVGTPPGGVFSGPGVSGNQFDPSAAGTGGPYVIAYNYTDGNGCSGSANSQTSVLCPVPDKPSSYSGALNICPGTTGKVYSVGTVAGATGYSWTPPVGSSIVSGSGTNQVTLDYSASFATSDICVTADNVCGSSVPKCKTVNRIDIPEKPKYIIGQRFSVCNDTLPYSVKAVADADSYIWSVGPGATILTGAGTRNVDIAFDLSYQDAPVCVTVENKCGSSAMKCKTVSPQPKKIPVIYAPSTVCAFQTGVALSVDPVPGALSYNWQIPNTVTLVSGQGTTSAIVDWGHKTKDLYVSAVNDCGAGPEKKKVIQVTCRMAGPGNSPSATFDLHPNPAMEYVDAILAVQEEGNADIYILNVLGQETGIQNVFLNAGLNEWRMSLAGMPAGMYSVVIVTRQATFVQKLVIG